jgi:hypothetical protein
MTVVKMCCKSTLYPLNWSINGRKSSPLASTFGFRAHNDYDDVLGTHVLVEDWFIT